VGPYSRWRAVVADQVRERPALASLLLGARGKARAVEELLCVVDQVADDSLLRSLGLSRRGAATAVLELWQVTIAPYWQRVLGCLEDECDARGRIVMTGGVERLLATLHPKVVWRSPVLEVPGGPDLDVRLDGRGLLLCPSLFLANRGAVLVRAEPESGLPALVFAAPCDTGLWDEPGDTAQALGALVGQTRAAVLRALTATCTTSQLASQLGISLAGASQHTAVLRETGLITTRRMRNSVLHSVTPLGMALLGGKLR
jgi:DNA-binding transcriptional ArsR family regulator